MYWNWVFKLLLPELFENPTNTKDSSAKNKEDHNKEKPETKPEGTNKGKKFFNYSPDGKINKKSLFTKAFALLSVIAIAYFIFGYGREKHVFIKNFCCNNSSNQKLKITTHSHGDVEIDLQSMYKHVYSEKLSSNGNESVHKIHALSDNNDNISFNVAVTISAAKDELTRYYRIDSGCQLKSSCPKTGGGTCDCCTSGDKSCCGANCAAADCCAAGSECKGGCCLFKKLVDFATLQPTPLNKITASSVFFSLLPTLLYIGVFIFLTRSTFKNHMGLYGKNSIFKIGQSLSNTTKSKITFKDVAGIKEEKEELEEIVDYLRHPQKYNSMGARTPKGVMLYGPPGTGKTLLAKAVSGEADVPFLESSGASFDDMFVGVGAKRVRELFEKAKKLAPCIIFIDEIDALATKRSNRYAGASGNDQTINQLLSEMDGFNTQTGIVVIAATNRLSSIDDAVLRPGRFDRHIQINLPDITERTEILKIHSRNKNISSSVDMDDLARKTPGFSGAQLENVLNEATLLTVRNNKTIITHVEIEEAIDRVMSGPSKKNRKVNFDERKQIAYHEAGHAIAGIYAKDGEVVEKITIVPRGKAAGYVLSTPKTQENIIQTKDQLLSILLTTLAGRAAEEIFFGKDKVSSGAANDLQKSTAIAKSMVAKLGMSDKVGMVQYAPYDEEENPYKNYYSEAFGELIDQEILAIVEEQYKQAKQIIEDNKHEFLLIVETLLLLETIDRKQIYFIHENKRIPKEAEAMKEKLFKQNKFINL